MSCIFFWGGAATKGDGLIYKLSCFEVKLEAF